MSMDGQLPCRSAVSVMQFLRLATFLTMFGSTFCQSQTFNTFDPETLQFWSLTHAAQQVNTSLQLTSTTDYAAGAAFWNSAQLIDNDFTISFSFQITGSQGTLDAANNGVGADGISVVITSSLPGSAGIWGQMGYEWAAPPMFKSVAVEFDTHFDEKDPKDTKGLDGVQQMVGPDGNHVGININGRTESIVAAHLPGLLNDGNAHHVWITYQVADKATLRVFYNPIEKVQPVNPVIKATVPFREILDGSSAFIGFVAGCQSSSAAHSLLSFEFIQGRASTATAAPVPVSSPSFVFANKTDQTLRLAPKANLSNAVTNTSSWLLSPSVSVDSSGQLMLTAATMDDSNKAGMAVCQTPLDIKYGFSVNFTVKMGDFDGPMDLSNDGAGGNGLALVLLPSNQLANNLSSTGPGYGGISPSIALELDTWYDAASDPSNTVSSITGLQQLVGADGNHIALTKNGELTALVASHIPDLINDGNQKHVWLDYYAFNATFMVFYNPIKHVKPATPVLAQVLNVSEVLGGAKQVFLGFTAANSAARQTHRVTLVALFEADGTSLLNAVSPEVLKFQRKVKKNKRLAAIVIPSLFAAVVGGGMLYGLIMYIVRRGKCQGQADIYRDPEDFKSLNAQSPTHSP